MYAAGASLDNVTSTAPSANRSANAAAGHVMGL
jgi:hypothetical protein